MRPSSYGRWRRERLAAVAEHPETLTPDELIARGLAFSGAWATLVVAFLVLLQTLPLWGGALLLAVAWAQAGLGWWAYRASRKRRGVSMTLLFPPTHPTSDHNR